MEYMIEWSCRICKAEFFPVCCMAMGSSYGIIHFVYTVYVESEENAALSSQPECIKTTYYVPFPLMEFL